MADLAPAGLGGNGQHGPQIVATYDYVDEAGRLLFQVLRRAAPKAFLQRRPDPKRPGEWIWKLEDTPRVLYRLPDLCAGVAKGDPVFVVEGEKDADRLHASMTLTANTYSHVTATLQARAVEELARYMEVE